MGRTNLFPTRALYNEFFEHLEGRIYTAQDSRLMGYLIIGRWRAGSDFHSLWAIAADHDTGKVLLDFSLQDYLPPGDMIITRMLTPEAVPFFKSGGFKPFKNILLLEGDSNTISIPHRRPAPGHLRRFRKEDLEEVLRVDESAFDLFWKLDSWNVRCISRYCDLNSVMVAEEDGKLVGYCIAGTNRYCGFIQRLAVDRGHQDQGWGKALLLEQVAWLRKKGARAFLVNTQEENATAQKMYREMGFNKSVAPRHIYGYEQDENRP